MRVTHTDIVTQIIQPEFEPRELLSHGVTIKPPEAVERSCET